MKLKGKVKIFLIFFLLTFFTFSIKAMIMESENYRLKIHSIDVGGFMATSSIYQLRGTIGEVVTGEAEDTSQKVKLGYQPLQEVYLAISLPTSVTLLPPIYSLTGGIGNGEISIMVITDNSAGYSLKVRSKTSPALSSGSNYFEDYTPENPGIPDFFWQVPATSSEFGFSPEGEDISQKFKDNGSMCSIGNQDSPEKCWYFFSTTDEIISQRFSSNHPQGTETKVKLRAEAGNQRFQPEGIYRATLIFTAVPN